MSQTFIISTIAIVAVLTLGGFIRSGLQNAQRLRGTTIEELLKAKSDELDEAFRNWALPPELNMSTPRPILYSAAAVARSRSRPRNALYAVFALASLILAALIYYGMSPSLMLKGFHEFLKSPQWHAWMAVPIIVYGGGIAAFVLSRYRKRSKERRLLQWGIPARARLTVMTRGGAGWCVFEFQDAAGIRYKFNENRPVYPEGGAAIVTVLYDPDKPSDFVCYPGERYAIAGST